jgi:hypothetical protein
MDGISPETTKDAFVEEISIAWFWISKVLTSDGTNEDDV